jgi:xylan 1,4-beta-xylosidase
VPFHGGFGLLNIHGIAKPAYRAYELLHRVGKQLLRVDGSTQRSISGLFAGIMM